MDWHSWLSDADLDPDLVYHFSLLFSGNQLCEDDIPHFDHEFLKSMGIAIAKHRLEILKLAKKKKYSGLRHFTRFLATAGSSIAKYLLSYSLRRRNSSAIVVVEAPAPARGNMLKRQRKMVVADGGGGGARVAPPTAAVAVKHAGEIRWDSMFQDLKPN